MEASHITSLAAGALGVRTFSLHRTEDEISLESILDERHDRHKPKELSLITAAISDRISGWSLKSYYPDETGGERRANKIQDFLFSSSGHVADAGMVLIGLRDSSRTRRHLDSDAVQISGVLEDVFNWLSLDKMRPSAPRKRFEWSFDVLSFMLAKAALHMLGTQQSYGIEIDGPIIRTHYEFSSPFESPALTRYEPPKSTYCAVGQVVGLENSYHFEMCKSVVLQSHVRDLIWPHEDVIEYSKPLDNSALGESLAMMATCALYSHRSWNRCIATSERSARLLWAKFTKDKLWTIDELGILNQDLTGLEERMQSTNEALRQDHRTAQFLSKEVITAMLDVSEGVRHHPDSREKVSQVRRDLHQFDQLVERVSSLEAKLHRIRQLYEDLRQLALVRNSFDALKMEYISQNYIRVAAFLVILFLPGIFISTLIGSRVIDTSWELSSYWLVIALPITFVIVGSLCVMCCFPGLTCGGRSCFRAVVALFRRNDRRRLTNEEDMV